MVHHTAYLRFGIWCLVIGASELLLEKFGYVPRDGFPFAVGVGRKNHFVSFFRRRCDFLNNVFLFLYDFIMRNKTAVYVHSIFTAFGKVAHMSDRRLYAVFAPQIFSDGFRL